MNYYNELLQKLNGKFKKKIGNNTYLCLLSGVPGDGIAIKYHNTYVVTVYGDGKVELNTGGWNTVTTQMRINKALRAMFNGVYMIAKRNDDMTFLQTSRGVYEFNRTISLNKYGHVINYWSSREKV